MSVRPHVHDAGSSPDWFATWNGDGRLALEAHWTMMVEEYSAAAGRYIYRGPGLRLVSEVDERRQMAGYAKAAAGQLTWLEGLPRYQHTH